MNLTERQSQVINTDKKSILVSASAGSGKTFVVIQRILKKIIESKINVDELLVVTFTNAAASELKERLYKGLTEALASVPKDNKEERKFLSAQIRKVWSSNISTIHSFCLSVIKDNFYVLGIDPTVSTIDTTEASILLSDSITEVLDTQYEENTKAFSELLDLMGSEEELISVLTYVYNFYAKLVDKEAFEKDVMDIYLNIDENLDLSQTEFGKKYIQNIKENVSLLYFEVANKLDLMAEDKDYAKPFEVFSVLERYMKKIMTAVAFDEIYVALNQEIDIPTLSFKKNTDEALNEDLKAVKKTVTDELKRQKTYVYKKSKDMIQELKSMAPIISCILSICKKIGDIYFAKKQQRNSIDFTDYEMLALKALKNEEICKRYLSKFKEIYIDEYQDTSFVQEAILSSIAKEDNVVMVGDVKQSIYGFRDAKPELFTSKYETYPDADEVEEDKKCKIVLANNFRSRSEVIDSVNIVFESLMSIKYGGARYTEKEKLTFGGLYDKVSEGQDYTTELNIIQNTDVQEIETEMEELIDSKNTALEVETYAVADKIKSMVGSYEIYDTKSKTFRKCKYSDIVILMQVISGAGETVAKVLKSKNIPVYCSSKTNFYETEEVSLITAFLKVIDNPYDDISLASVMYSLIGKFTLDEITIIRLENKHMNLWDNVHKYKEYLEENEKTENELYTKLHNFLNLIKTYQDYIYLYDVATLICKLYVDTSIYDSIKQEKDGVLKAANLDALVQIASSYNSLGSKTIYSFVNYIENMKKSNSVATAPKIMGENEDVVKIMTIHHSKGLEFPIVILMDAARIYKFQDAESKIVCDESLGIGINTLDRKYNICYPGLVKIWIKDEIKKRLISEKLRLLYVAMTRAKEKLIIYGTVKNVDKFMSKIYVSPEGTCVPDIVARQNNSYLKNLVQAYLICEKNTPDKNMKLNIINPNIECENEEAIFTSYSLQDIVKKFNTELLQQDEEYLKVEKNRLNVKYKYEDELLVEQKYTATQIKKAVSGMQEDMLALEELKPLAVTRELTSLSFGTFIHSIIEKLNFSDISLENIQNTVNFEAQKYENCKINTNKVSNMIYKMFKTKFADYVKDAKEIHHEYEFVMRSDLQFIPEATLKTKTLIQGVIDLYLVTRDNKHIIIDFKTDKVKSEQELIDRYNSQLIIYKEGVELSRGIKVAGMYIYSFELQKLIEV